MYTQDEIAAIPNTRVPWIQYTDVVYEIFLDIVTYRGSMSKYSRHSNNPAHNFESKVVRSYNLLLISSLMKLRKLKVRFRIFSIIKNTEASMQGLGSIVCNVSPTEG